MSPALLVSGARVRLGAADALRGLDLSVEAGEYRVVLGPSGAGKTTLLRAIAGLEPLQAGSVALDGETVSAPGVRVPPEKRRIGMVFQNLALWPHLTVRQHLDFVLRRTSPPSERRGQSDALLETVRISPLADRVPSELSGGEAQRLALARALAGSPRILLLDEPLGHVDESLRADLASELRAIQRRMEIATVHVTHDQEEGLSIADRVAVLRDGRIEQEGSPEQVHGEPKTVFVARFLGRQNAVAAVVEGGRVRSPLGEFPAPAGATPGERVAVVARAESIALASEGIDAKVVARSFEGGTWTHRLALDGAEVRARFARPLAVGDRVRVRVEGEVRVLREAP